MVDTAVGAAEPEASNNGEVIGGEVIDSAGDETSWKSGIKDAVREALQEADLKVSVELTGTATAAASVPAEEEWPGDGWEERPAQPVAEE